MSELIYKCIDPKICGLLESGEHTYILRNSNLGKVFINTEYEGLQIIISIITLLIMNLLI